MFSFWQTIQTEQEHKVKKRADGMLFLLLWLHISIFIAREQKITDDFSFYRNEILANAKQYS